MYQFAYSAICEELPASSSQPAPRPTLPDAIELIEAADKVHFASHVQLQILSDFRRLWLSITKDLMGEGQDLPPESRATVHIAASRVLEEIERRRFSPDCVAKGWADASACAPEWVL